MAELLKELDALSIEKRELLLKKLHRRKMALQGQGSDSNAPIMPAPRDRPLPLSFSQQRLWFLDQFAPGTPAFNLVSSLRLSGDLHVPALRQTLDEIVRRHESLRTIFAAQDGQPAQIIQPPSGAAFAFVDLHPCPAAEQEARVAPIILAETQHAFDLTCGPLFRATLIRLDPRTHLLCINVHHIVFDGWSTGVLLDELATLYHAFRASQPAPLPPLDIQYADYAVWQRQRLQGAYLEQQLAYWKQRLGDDSAPLHLPLDRPRPAIRTTRGAYLPYEIDPDLAGGLKRLASSIGVSPYIVLLAALKTLLYRYTNDAQISVGTFIANRQRRAIEPLIGFFVNTLVLRTDLSGGPTFRELLGRVKEVSVGAYEHQELPFEKLLEELQPARDMSRTPFFQVMLVLQNMPLGELDLPDVTVEPFELKGDGNTLSTHFDMTFWLSEQEGGFTGSLEYNTDLFDRTTMARMAGHYQVLLEGIVAAPDRGLAELPLLTATERQQLLVEWNATMPSFTLDRGLLARFADQVTATPTALAVVDGDQQLTYQDLSMRAARLAGALRARGISREVIVPLLAERGADLLTAILAIFATGGAYLPLDPAQPPQRLRQVLHESRCGLLLATRACAAPLMQTLDGASSTPIVFWLDDLLMEGPPTLSTFLSPTEPSALAYVLFTSGSTGMPKGVLIEHAGMLNHLLLMVEQLGLTATDAIAQSASQCFDISVWQLLTALLVGGQVVVLDDTTMRDPQAVVAAIARHKITILQVVPSLLAVLLDVAGEATPHDSLAHLRWLIPTGEALPPALVRRWLERCPQVPLLNAYGPAECADDVTLGPITTPPADDTLSMTIGRPVANMQVYVLDGYGTPVPVGVIGELYIGGVGVGRGYLGRPDLTAECFVPNPFAEGMGDGGWGMEDSAPIPARPLRYACPPSPIPRLYKTGDLVRYRAGGNLEFVGRADQQVKVRGYRIELGEIEVALGRHELVREAVVLVREDPPGQKRLVAYIVPKIEDRGLKIEDSGSDAREPLSSILYPLSSELRRFLKEQLPDYMVPAAYVVLAALPLTPNGKVDRRALPPPDAAAYARSAATQRPHTPTEQLVAAIWAQVLQLDMIGIEENFFALGGHSLLATQVISRLKSAFQVDLPLRTLFEKPTIAELAAELARQPARSGDLATIVPAPRDRPLPLSFSQQRLWFLDQFDPGTSAFNLVSSIRLSGDLHLPALRQALDEIVRRHESLRTVFAAHDGQPIQIVQPPAGAAFALVDLQLLAPAEREAQARRRIMAETRRAFDLTRGPLFLATVIQLAPRAVILCLNVHHIVSDGWSHGILMQELVTLYRAFRAGEPAPLPPLAVQYADYAVWQRQRLQGAYLEQQLAYWRQQLGDTSAPLNLPTDRPRPPVRTYAGATVPSIIDKVVTLGLKLLASSAGVSLYVVVLAALQTLLHRYTHDPQIGVGTYIANRHHRAIEPLIGFFVNTLVLRTDLSGQPTFRELVGRVREVALGAYEHQDLPFEKLIEELQPTRDMSHTPFFQVLLVLQNTPFQADALPELTIEMLDLHDDVHAHFDLTLWLSEGDEEIIGSLEYNTDLFDRDTMVRMTTHLTNLLHQIVADPDQRIDMIDILMIAERAHLLQAWNSTRAPFDIARDVRMLVETWAEQTPEAPAVLWQDEQLTYAALDRRANRLAEALRAAGVGPEVRVGICVERSPDMIVCVLAIWKAGGAYVPLDPSYPPERLAFMIHDSAPRVIISRSNLCAALPRSDAAILCLDAHEDQLACYAEDRQPGRTVIHDLAYVVYTSGSTDTPRGVLVEHRSLANAYYAWRAAYDLRPGMRHLQMASCSFDVFAGDLVRALCSGGILVICPRELLLEPPRLYHLIRREGPVCAEFVPAVIRELMRYAQETGQPLAGLERLIVGSDLWYMDEYRQLRDLCVEATRIINSYGVSEATIDSTYFECGAPSLPVERAVPIGRPFANTQVFILDNHLQPVPQGVIGELYIGGAGLARGYLNRPALTAERFVPNPFAQGMGDGGWGMGNESSIPHPPSPIPRLYKTGDLARSLADGTIQFLGRNDHQVKIRGFRIELDEVQTVLSQHPQVAEALVTARTDERSNTYLIAYVIGDRDLQVGQLRTYFKERLPEYMIPAAYVRLDAFPLTPNGKIDRQALPAPDLSARSLETALMPPRDAVELQLVEIWEDLLGVAPIGAQDNFFDLGGHSLLAVHLMARIRRRFDKHLPLSVLFQGATVEHLAAVLRRGADPAIWAPLVAMQTRGQKPALFCVPGAGGNVIGFYDLARRLGTDRPIYGLQARGIDGETAPHTSIEEMAAYYVDAIRQVHPHGPYFLCGYSFGSWVAFEIAQQLRRQGGAIALLAILNTPTPMVMSDDFAPSTEPHGQQSDETTVLLNVARNIEATFGKSLGLSRERLQHLSADEQISRLTEALKRVAILPPEAETNHVRGFVNVFKVNYEITYVPKEWLPTRIVLFRASERRADDDVIPPPIRDDPAWGWGTLADAPVEVYFVPGTHMTLLMEPHVQGLAEQLGRYLRHVDALNDARS